MTTDPTKSKPRRRWSRFRLPTMLVVMALICVTLGRWVSSVQRQKRAMAAIQIQGNGIWVTYDVDDAFYVNDPGKIRPKVWIQHQVDTVFGKDIYKILGYDWFCSAYAIYRDKNSDPVNDDLILSHCRDLPNLHTIDLRNASDLGIVNLRGHRSVEDLYLIDCENITDASAPIISDITSLRKLLLNGTNITKASVPLLSQMKNLCHLNLPNFQLSDEEKRMLHLALPRTQINFND